MKNRILSSLLLTAIAGICYFGFSSNSTGATGANKTCASAGCHVNQDNKTNVTIIGLPITGSYTPGATYSLTLGVVRTGSKGAGFNMACSAGTFSITTSGNAQTNTAKDEVTHVLTGNAGLGVTLFTFNWIAPTGATTPDVTFSAIGNAVNKNGNNSGDTSGVFTVVVPGSGQSNAIGDVQATKVSSYPNPVIQNLTVAAGNIKTIQVISYTGAVIPVTYNTTANNAVVDCSNLPHGMYTVKATTTNNSVYISNFIK